MLTIILFIVVLSLLVFVHELGHFVTAKRAGARVDEFSVGFPPRLWSKTKEGTRYSIGAIPFGGYVKIFGEDETQVKAPGSFGSLSLGKRAVVLAAGVAMNVVLAIVLMGIVAALGQPSLITDQNRALAKDVSLTIIQVAPESPAEAAGIEAGDALKGVHTAEEELISEDVEEVTSFLRAHQGQEVTLTVKRGETEMPITVTLRENPTPQEGALGVALAPVGTIASPLWRAPWDGVKTTWNMLLSIFFALEMIAKEGVEGLSGPVGIATLTGDAARLGLVYLLQFTAFLSLNLAILNILPFPALDGGRLVFLVVEKIKGSPVTPKVEQVTHGLGFALLMLLIVWITFQDIQRLL